jgi:hypothetical protein
VDVTLNVFGIEPQLCRTEEEIGDVELTPKHVDGLLQRALRAFRIAFRPEQRHQSIAPHAALNGEYRQQAETFPVCPDLIQGGTVALDREAAEGA